MKNSKTKDLYLAAALIACGEKLICSEKSSNEVWFIFENSESLNTLKSKHLTGNLTVNVAQYQNALRQLKNIIFQT